MPPGSNLNVIQSYVVSVKRHGQQAYAENLSLGGNEFFKPADNIGNKSIPDYDAYASQFIYEIRIPGCARAGRVFVGQRKEGFVVNLGEVFDLVNTNPVGPRDGEPNTLFDKNVTSIALEVPISCLTSERDPIIGGYTTARSQATDEDYQQVSRLGMPLVNELVIGLPDKDKFNAQRPER